jgi:hypothetical protein
MRSIAEWLEQIWVLSQHPPTQRNLRGGRCSSVEKSQIKKSKKIIEASKKIDLDFCYKATKISNHKSNHLPIYRKH